MVEVGSQIRATVVRKEPYGIWLKHGNEDLLVLAPEVSWQPKRCQQIEIGTEIAVQVLRYNYRDRCIVGSIRRAHPEENPYRKLSLLDAETVLHGRITFATSVDATVHLSECVYGNIPLRELPDGWKIGDPIDVQIDALEVNEGRLELRLAAKPAVGRYG